MPKIRALFEPISRISSAVFMAALFKLTPCFPVDRCAQLTAFLTNFHSISVTSLYDRKKGEECFVTSLLVMRREGDNEGKPCPFYKLLFSATPLYGLPVGNGRPSRSPESPIPHRHQRLRSRLMVLEGLNCFALKKCISLESFSSTKVVIFCTPSAFK